MLDAKAKEFETVEVPGLPSPTIRELLVKDARPVNPVLVADRNDLLGEPNEGGETERFFSREFQQLENKFLWSRVWQIAGREEQIPKVGDYFLYETAGKSLIIARTDKDEIRAYYNACLHRGRQLCDADGHAP